MKNIFKFFGFAALAFLFTFTVTVCEPYPVGNIPPPGGEPNVPGGETDGDQPVFPTTPLDINAAGVQTFTSNSGGNKSLTGSPYGYEMWTDGGNNNKLIWYGPSQGGGAAFKAEWSNPKDFLGRVGYYWGSGGKYTQYKNMYADFAYTRSGRSTAGNFSYIGIYGWAKNPGASKAEEKLIEYYIVEDWFGNQWQTDTTPVTISTTGGTLKDSYTMDGAEYKVITNVRENKPSIEGTKTFTQYFSIRQTPRKNGTVSITGHFKKWEGMGLILGNMYEAKFLVEAGGGTGWLDFTWLKITQEDSPRSSTQSGGQ
jgi:endo-1,4-beta-xylanase